MALAKRILRGLSMAFAVLLMASVTTGAIMEQYPAPLDTFFGTLSSRIVTGETSDEDWIYESDFETAKEAFDGFKEFAIRESQETVALLKNENNALPLSETAKITLLGLRSYAAIYGNNGGSTPDTKTVEDNLIYDCFKEAGFEVNPSMLATYAKYCEDLEWAPSSYGSTTPSYKELNVTDKVAELSVSELAALNANYNSEFATYHDAAIVVVGRPGGESYNYIPGGQDSTTGNILGLTAKEKEILQLAKDNFDKVIVLVNDTKQMELKELRDDADIDAILWIGYPGAYGFRGVASVLNGKTNPSAYLGDIYAANTAVNPAMMNFGGTSYGRDGSVSLTYGHVDWTDASTYSGAENVNSYLVQAEGIYTGYRYYETRYADIVEGRANASAAKAGTYVNADTTVATVDGTWNYSNEVVYPFGYGMSYTTFTQTLGTVTISEDKKTATVPVTVTNTGDKSGKSVIQLYAQTPYTQYDITNGVEKAAVQLMDYEKTPLLTAGASHTVTMKVDLANLASYDYKNAKTFIVDDGDYYFAIGDNSHDALNNILAKKGKTTADGMTANGNADKAYKWTWSDSPNGVDATTFSVSATGETITNALVGDYSMDINDFIPNTVTYLTRNDWNGTYPKEVANLSSASNPRLKKLLGNDFYELKNEDTSEYKWGITSSNLTINNMKQAAWDDPRWAELVDMVTIQEFLTFAANAFHHIQEIPSVGYLGNNADDGPGGSDSHYFQEGSYKGTPYADAADYTGYGTRVAPSPTNLAYSWNKELAYENGEIILGESTLVLGLPIMIGPGANIHRHAWNGRGAEYYSEDPILSGYTGSAVTQGAQSKGCLVNIKHAAFNDQEINRSGVAVFMTEQKAREIELRNLQQIFVASGKPASFESDETKEGSYKQGALGVMTSYNRIGAVASSANKGVMVDIMREEWGFKGYNVTDFTGVSLKAAPKESILYGTTAFCGFGAPNLDYWTSTTNTLGRDREMCAAIKQNIKYVLYSLANSAAVNGTNENSYREQLNSTWRVMYKSMEGVSGGLFAAAALGWIVLEVLLLVRKKEEVK